MKKTLLIDGGGEGDCFSYVKREKMKDVYVGEFWFSDDVDNKRVGYIKKEKGEYRLIILESFEEKDREGYITGKTYYKQETNKIINGKIFEGNEYISLVGLSFWDYGFDIKEYYFKYLIFGFNFKEKDHIYFNSFEFTFNGLSEFIGKESFYVNAPQNKIIIDVNEEYSIIDIGKYDGLDLCFINRWSREIDDAGPTIRGKSYKLLNSINFNNNYFIKISSANNNITLDKIENFIKNFQRLFSLIFGENIKIKHILIKKEIFWTKEQINFLKVQKPSDIKNIKIIFNQGFITKNNKLPDQRKNKEILFDLSEVNNILDIITNFFNNSGDKLKTIYNLYYATLQNKGLHLENQFLNLIQAIEGMYYKSDLPQNIPEKKEEELREKIEKLNLPKEYNKKIEFLYKKSLSQKLSKLSKYLQVNFELNGKDIKNKIEKIRNCFSHGGDREDFVNLDLFKVTILLQTVLELFIIKELGIEEALYNSIKEYKINTELQLNIG